MGSSVPQASDGASGRRYSIVVGVSDYAEPFHDLPGCVEGARRIADLLATMGYEQVLTDISANPTSAQLRQELSAWSRTARLGPDDVVVAYFAGHGAVHGGRHYLLGSGDGDDFPFMALPGADFVGMVTNSLAGHSLVIIDTSFAAATARDAARSVLELGATQPLIGETWVLSAAQSRENAYLGALVRALEHVLVRPLAGARQPYLSVGQVAEAVNEYFDTQGIYQTASASGFGTVGPDPFFPNPSYVSGLPRDSLDIPSVVRLRREQDDHFMPRSRGVTHPSEPGDFFVGRTRALAAAADWLGEPRSADRLFVVTGRAGSGKSALLGRVLALMDPDSTARLSVPPELLPPTGPAVIAMNCRHKTAADVVAHLSAALDLRISEDRGMVDALGARTDPVVILLDGLDEAIDSDRVISDVVGPLSMMSAIRLIVGTRRSLLPSLRSLLATRVIDLDTAEFSDADDLRKYVFGLLVGQGNPSDDGRSGYYQAHPARAEAAAETIARQAHGSFVEAQSLAHAVLHDPALDGDMSLLLGGVDAFFERYLERFGPHKELALRLFLPLAYAQGAGLPEELWSPLAEALAHVPCEEDHVLWFLAQEGAGAFLTRNETPDGTVYRFLHDSIAERLRTPEEDGTRHRLVAEALVRQVPVAATGERDWSAAHPYIREHLATHAAAGGVLDELLRDDAYVHAAQSGPLLRALVESGAIGAARTPGASSPSAPTPPPADSLEEVARVLSDRVTVLVVATEWSSAHGGLSTFNRHLCVALAAAGALVFCTVVSADDSDIANAAAKGVTLLCHRGAPGAPDYGKLTRRPALPPGVEPDLVIGHARITGPAAAHLHEELYPQARRLHFVHMAPDEIEWHKLDDSTDRSQLAEERTDIERKLGASAHRLFAVGPRLYKRFRNELWDEDAPEPLQVAPGFDLPTPGRSAKRTPPPGLLRVLMIGRTEDAALKGVDLGARACGLVHELRTKASTEPIELVVRGAPQGMADVQRELVRDWSGAPGLDVVMRPYSRELSRLDSDMARASLVIMPSRAEGFGLVGVEAIIRGVPLLLSEESGLATLLRDHLKGDADPLIVPVTRDFEVDAEKWAARIEKCLVDRDDAFARMADVRSRLAAHFTWASAAASVLGEAAPRPGAPRDRPRS
ncbi:glycosyltransferase [Streptomyces sp. NPDC002888]|uniref:glycosyltransferase n=1 Tax=Streptomyces sp. NPDC002888 TaxID=3364668 RepID=UPI0036A90D70